MAAGVVEATVSISGPVESLNSVASVIEVVACSSPAFELIVELKGLEAVSSAQSEVVKVRSIFMSKVTFLKSELVEASISSELVGLEADVVEVTVSISGPVESLNSVASVIEVVACSASNLIVELEELDPTSSMITTVDVVADTAGESSGLAANMVEVTM